MFPNFYYFDLQPLLETKYNTAEVLSVQLVLPDTPTDRGCFKGHFIMKCSHDKYLQVHTAFSYCRLGVLLWPLILRYAGFRRKHWT